MPSTHIVPVTTDVRIYTVTTKNGEERLANVLQRGGGHVYVHYVGTDKRLDEWIPEEQCKLAFTDAEGSTEEPGQPQPPAGPPLKKRKRVLRAGDSPSPNSPSGSRPGSVRPSELDALLTNGAAFQEEVTMTEEDYDIQHHKQITAQRNFEKVTWGDWEIKTWYFSPYPLIETEIEELSRDKDSREQVASTSAAHGFKIPGVARTTARSHGRTSDILAGGLGRQHAGEKATLWVCELCFKYMADCTTWEVHRKVCTMNHPPGRKVYQRGAHTIWEVDGAKEKLYCQNLSLFGKLFIDVKTLFFDCDNFLFYILTDATSTLDIMLGFFSKEKVSYDDYNLACIMTLPPFQRKGYGMLMIEFSYELSRRSGKVGTPERPLSDLGLRSYLAYWVATLVRFFRRVLTVLPPEMPKLTTVGNLPDLTRPLKDLMAENGLNGGNGNGNGNGNANSNTTNGVNGVLKKRKRNKGWDGEVDPSLGMAPLSIMDDPLFTTHRVFDSIHRPDGGAETHVTARCTLADIAHATNLRVEDAAFALNECGMLMKRLAETDGEDVVLLTRERVEQVAKERNVKRPCMDLSRVLLDQTEWV
ncbi:acyl-CoA N-acyltransferase [Crucibulum laeve]|uniref:histone acetyltransferase n=1 Tax=Crucibulum laeve TaxID=68775 RepID=A0A5C3M0D8_9AGAR|nr:acyl-CoA N-acyltransferase [Crucibulum laeve]